MKITISAYSPDDKKEVLVIYGQVLLEEWQVESNLKQLDDDLEESFQDEVVLVAKQGKRTVGFISWYEPDAFIHHLYVKNDCRGQGVGQQLLQCALDRLRYPIRLKCLQNNKKALNFYAVYGWYMVAEGSSDEGDFYLLEYSKIESPKANEPKFLLHERLQNDCYRLGKLPFCHLLLIKNAEVPWFILVPETNKIEIHELETNAQKKLMEEALEISLMLKNILKVDKVNMGAIGNLVPQLHFHVVGRRVNDYCWPKVVWGAEGFRAYEAEELSNLKGLVKSSFGSRLTL